MIPREIRILFWDVDLNTFNPRSYPDYTTFRVLEYGDKSAVTWLRQLFTDDDIQRVIRTERRLSRKSATFWALLYGIPTSKVSALAH